MENVDMTFEMFSEQSKLLHKGDIIEISGDLGQYSEYEILRRYTKKDGRIKFWTKGIKFKKHLSALPSVTFV